MAAPPSQVRQNYHQDCEAAINRQINLELYASYVYLSMSYYFDRDDVALKNFAKYFLHQSHEEREHAEKLMKLQNQRGGRIFLQDIKKPDRDDWENGLTAMECALHLEKNVNQSLLELHKLATEKNDPHIRASLCFLAAFHLYPRDLHWPLWLAALECVKAGGRLIQDLLHGCLPLLCLDETKFMMRSGHGMLSY